MWITRLGDSGPSRRTRCSRFESLQQLHHQVERSLLGHPEIVELHRVGRSQLRRRFRFPAEACDRRLGQRVVARREHLGPDQLDGGGPGEHAVARPVDLAHAAPAQHLAEPVAPHLALAAHLLAQPRHHGGDHHRRAEHEVVGVVHEEGIAQRAELVGTGRVRHDHADRVHRGRDQSGHEHPARIHRHDAGRDQDDRPGPGDHRLDVDRREP